MSLLNARDSFEFYLRCFFDDSIFCQNISLVDPISMQVLKSPCRGINCSHLQCFELDVFESMNAGKTEEEFKCQLCGNLSHYSTVYVDFIALSILTHFPTARSFKLFRNGHIELRTQSTAIDLGSSQSGLNSNADNLFQYFMLQGLAKPFGTIINWEKIASPQVWDFTNFINNFARFNVGDIDPQLLRNCNKLVSAGPLTSKTLEDLEVDIQCGLVISKVMAKKVIKDITTLIANVRFIGAKRRGLFASIAPYDDSVGMSKAVLAEGPVCSDVDQSTSQPAIFDLCDDEDENLVDLTEDIGSDCPDNYCANVTAPFSAAVSVSTTAAAPVPSVNDDISTEQSSQSLRLISREDSSTIPLSSHAHHALLTAPSESVLTFAGSVDPPPSPSVSSSNRRELVTLIEVIDNDEDSYGMENGVYSQQIQPVSLPLSLPPNYVPQHRPTAALSTPPSPQALSVEEATLSNPDYSVQSVPSGGVVDIPNELLRAAAIDASSSVSQPVNVATSRGFDPARVEAVKQDMLNFEKAQALKNQPSKNARKKRNSSTAKLSETRSNEFSVSSAAGGGAGTISSSQVVDSKSAAGYQEGDKQAIGAEWSHIGYAVKVTGAMCCDCKSLEHFIDERVGSGRVTKVKQVGSAFLVELSSQDDVVLVRRKLDLELFRGNDGVNYRIRVVGHRAKNNDANRHMALEAVQVLYSYILRLPQRAMDVAKIGEFYRLHPNMKHHIQRMPFAEVCSLPLPHGSLFYDRAGRRLRAIMSALASAPSSSSVSAADSCAAVPGVGDDTMASSTDMVHGRHGATHTLERQLIQEAHAPTQSHAMLSSSTPSAPVLSIPEHSLSSSSSAASASFSTSSDILPCLDASAAAPSHILSLSLCASTTSDNFTNASLVRPLPAAANGNCRDASPAADTISTTVAAAAPVYRHDFLEGLYAGGLSLSRPPARGRKRPLPAVAATAGEALSNTADTVVRAAAATVASTVTTWTSVSVSSSAAHGSNASLGDSNANDSSKRIRTQHAGGLLGSAYQHDPYLLQSHGLAPPVLIGSQKQQSHASISQQAYNRYQQLTDHEYEGSQLCGGAMEVCGGGVCLGASMAAYARLGDNTAMELKDAAAKKLKIGGVRQKQFAAPKSATPCRYFHSPRGCKFAGQCPFRHVN